MSTEGVAILEDTYHFNRIDTNGKLFPREKQKRKKVKTFFDNFELLILALPAIFYFIIFHYIPMLGIVIAFKNYHYDLGIIKSKWVGLKNFEFFFSSHDALKVTVNTVLYSSVFIITGTVCAIVIALLLYEIKNKIAIKIYQTTMILPHFLSWVIVGYITYVLLNPVFGVANHILSIVGVKPVEWYTELKYWPFILVFTNIWKHIGMNCIIYYASLMGIEESYYEAAKMDGATRWQQTWYISIPFLIPLITILSILALGNLFRGDFGLFYQIPRDVGVLYPVTDVIDTYVFRGLRNGNIGITAAVGFFQSFVGLAMVLLTNFIVKRINPENTLF